MISASPKDLTIGWQNLNLLSKPNATLAPQARQARGSGENMNYLLSSYSDILSMIIGSEWWYESRKIDIFHFPCRNVFARAVGTVRQAFDVKT